MIRGARFMILAMDLGAGYYGAAWIATTPEMVAVTLARQSPLRIDSMTISSKTGPGKLWLLTPTELFRVPFILSPASF